MPSDASQALRNDARAAVHERPWAAGAWLLAIVVAGLVLRMTGIGFLLPGQPEPDGVVYQKQVQILRDGVRAQESEPLYAFYPHVVARLAAAMPTRDPNAAPARTRDEHLERAREPIRNIRIVVALLSLLSVPATWWLARRFLPDPWPAYAAAWVATSVLLLWFAQQARPHAAQTSFVAIAVMSALVVRERGGLRASVFAGLAAGLAIGCLQNGLAVLPCLALAGVLRWREDRAGRARLFVGLAAAVAIVLVCVRLFYPFLFAGTRKGGIATDTTHVQLSGHIVDLEMFNGKGFATVARTLWEYDPLITALATLGGLVALVELARGRWSGTRLQRDFVWIVLAFVVPYALVIGAYERTYQRFCTLLVPFLCVAATYAVYRTVTAARAWGDAVRAAAVVFACACVGFQGYVAWRLVDARAQVDTITEAAQWIEAHVDPARRVSVLPTVELPLLQSQAARGANSASTLDVRFPWFSYLWPLEPEAFSGTTWNLYAMPLSTEKKRAAARADPEAFVRAQDADYVVLEVFSNGRFPLLSAIREQVARLGTLEARISPDAVDRGENLPFVYQDDGYPYTTPWYARTLHLRCVGPIVEIYKLR